MEANVRARYLMRRVSQLICKDANFGRNASDIELGGGHESTDLYAISIVNAGESLLSFGIRLKSLPKISSFSWNESHIRMRLSESLCSLQMQCPVQV